MEKLRTLVNEIAYTKDYTKLSIVHRSLIPLFSLSSSVYSLALSLRRYLYHFAVFSTRRLPVAVISVGNLTWGGNGKTPMVKFIAQFLSDSGISPLVLTRGYAGGDEAKMLARHFAGKHVKIGIGANRAAVAVSLLKQYGFVDSLGRLGNETSADRVAGTRLDLEKIGAVVLDDGMQHWSLHRDLDIVMVNGLSLWGNCRLIPLGPLREPLRALGRADVVVVHHANLVSEQTLKDIELMIGEIKDSLPIFFSGMIPSHFLEVGNINFRIPLSIIHESVVLCVSAIGSANAFVQGVEKLGACYVDRFDFSDHHFFQPRDIEVIVLKLRALESKFGSNPLVVVTEKDYDRDSEILLRLSPFKVLVLCSELQIIPNRGHTESSFVKLLKELLEVKLSAAKPERE